MRQGSGVSLTKKVSMFEQTFIEAKEQTRSHYTLVLSSFVQAGAVGVLVLVPLFYTQVLPSVSLRSVLAAPAPPRVAIPLKAAAQTAWRATAARMVFVSPVIMP